MAAAPEMVMVNSFIRLSPSVQLVGVPEPSTTDEEMFSRSSQVPGSQSSDFSTGDVFTDIKNPLGR